MCLYRYKGHKNSEYKIDAALTHDDAVVVSGSEDGHVYFWELVEVLEYETTCLQCPLVPLEHCSTETDAEKRTAIRRLCGLLSLVSPNTALPADSRFTRTC